MASPALARRAAPRPAAPAAARGARPGGPAPRRPPRRARSPCAAKTSSGGPSARTPPPGSSTTTRSTSGSASATRCSTRISVVSGRRRRASASRTSAAPAGSRLAVGSSSSSRSGPQRQHAGQRQPLLLAAGQGGGGPVAAVREADPVAAPRRPAARSRLGRHAAVLQAERDVVAGAGHHQLGLRVLEEDADPLAGLARVEPVDLDGALGLAGVLGQQAGQRGEQGALAGAGRPEQQHPLAALDAQVDAAHGPGPAAGVPPPEPAQRRPSRHAAIALGRQTARVRGRTGTGRARRSGPAPGSAPSRRRPAIDRGADAR